MHYKVPDDISGHVILLSTSQVFQQLIITKRKAFLAGILGRLNATSWHAAATRKHLRLHHQEFPMLRGILSVLFRQRDPRFILNCLPLSLVPFLVVSPVQTLQEQYKALCCNKQVPFLLLFS